MLSCCELQFKIERFLTSDKARSVLFNPTYPDLDVVYQCSGASHQGILHSAFVPYLL
jgi:hypothetical protein